MTYTFCFEQRTSCYTETPDGGQRNWVGTQTGPIESGSPSGPGTQEIRASVDRLLQSPDFRIPTRRARLLTYLVDRTLAGERNRINEYAIGVDVFDKPASFDPKLDAVVRAEISRLRQNLKEYYAGPGLVDPIRIDLPARGYFAAFSSGLASTAAAPEIRAGTPISPKPFPWRIAVGTLVALASVGALLAWRISAGKPRIDSVVVLPFEDLSADHQSGYLADGLTDEVTNDLANLNGLRVIARTSAFLFKGKGVDVRQIGRELNVEAVLEGSVVRDGDHVRIRAQFNRTLDGSHLWSHVYDTHFRDLISVQQDIAQSIADDLQLSRSKNGNAALIPQGSTTDPEAHDLYLRGLEAANAGTAEGVQNAITLLKAAIAKDPRYAAPWFSLAKMLEAMGYFGGWPPGLADQVRSDLNHALQLDPQMAVAHAHLAYLDWEYGYDWDQAEREFRLALQQGNRSEPHKLYAMSLADRGRFAESHEHLRIAEDLAPLDSDLLFFEGGVLAWERRFPEAEQKYQAMLQRNPNTTTALAALAYIKTWEKDCGKAQEYAARMIQLSPTDYRTGSVRFAVSVCNGDIAGALKLREEDKSRRSPAIEQAQGYAYLGDKDTALKYLEQAVEQHNFGATTMKQTPYFDSLHGDPRFIALERRVGLDP
jgi:TolB-like protein